MTFDLKTEPQAILALKRAIFNYPTVGKVFSHKLVEPYGESVREYIRFVELIYTGELLGMLSPDWVDQHGIKLPTKDRLYDELENTLILYAKCNPTQKRDVSTFIFLPDSGISYFLLYNKRTLRSMELLGSFVGKGHRYLTQIHGVYEWYLQNKQWLSVANYGSWEAAGFQDDSTFMQYYVKTLDSSLESCYSLKSPAWWKFVDMCKSDYHVDLLAGSGYTLDKLPEFALNYEHSLDRRPKALFSLDK